MPTTHHENTSTMNDTSAANALDFAGLFPFLSLGDSAVPLGPSGLNDLSEEHLMELIHTLDGVDGDENEADSTDCQIDDTDDVKAEKPSFEDVPTSDMRAANGKATRVRTYTARKQEIASLLKELPHLEGYVDMLKHQAAKAHNQTDSLEKTRLINATLRDSIHRQQYTLARLESAISLYRTRQERMIPMDTFVHLSRDPVQRLSTVAALRPRLLRDALRFIRERTCFVDHSVPCTEQTAFTGASGDRCAVKFCVSPIEGSTNVKQAFDALRFYIGHTDVMITEATGDVITREDRTNFVDGGVSNAHQSRLLRSMADGFQVESNAIVFADYQPQDDEFGGGRALGIIITAAVGKDDQFPYSPDTRLRRDLTSVMLVKTYVRSDSEMAKSGDPSKKRNGKDSRSRYGVVMVRHSFHRLHRGNVAISNRDLSDVCDRLLAEGNVLFDTVQASVDDSVAAEFAPLKNDQVTTIDQLPQSPEV